MMISFEEPPRPPLKVHHVNGAGRDGGVIYTELLGRESRGVEVARR